MLDQMYPEREATGWATVHNFMNKKATFVFIIVKA